MGGATNATAGGFFPNGVNGNINTSSAGVAITTTTNASVTPTCLTTNQASVVLDASASTSASGNLKYFYMVLPGQLTARVATDPNQSKSYRRLRQWTGCIYDPTYRDGLGREHVEEPGNHVELPAIDIRPVSNS